MARPTLFTHRKFLRLVRAVGSRPLALGALEMLWASSYESGEDRVGTAEDIADTIGWTDTSIDIAKALLDAGFLDKRPRVPGEFVIHDLWDHAPDYVTKRRKREIERQSKGKKIRDLVDDGRRTADTDRDSVDAVRQLQTGTSQVADCQIEVDRTPAPAPAPAPALLLKGSVEDGTIEEVIALVRSRSQQWADTAKAWQSGVAKALVDIGLRVEWEVPIVVDDERDGRIDLVGLATDGSALAVEVDRTTPREKSLKKLRAYEAATARLVLLRATSPKVKSGGHPVVWFAGGLDPDPVVSNIIETEVGVLTLSDESMKALNEFERRWPLVVQEATGAIGRYCDKDRPAAAELVYRYPLDRVWKMAKAMLKSPKFEGMVCNPKLLVAHAPGLDAWLKGQGQ